MLDNFIDITDLNRNQLVDIVKNKVPDNNLENKNIGCLYEKPSTRTRLSFAVGINNLNGKVIDLKLQDLNFSREPVGPAIPTLLIKASIFVVFFLIFSKKSET